MGQTSTESRCYNDRVVFFSRAAKPARRSSVGEWLSLVEHLVRDQGVGGSNPLSPTISNQVLVDTRRVGEKQGLPQKDLHWRKCFLCRHELPPYSSGIH